MFKKLISNLPFNPSLIGQVAFYAKRMNQESAIRRTGLLFVVLAMLLQMFAVVSPPEPTLASGSNNDIVRNGFDDQADAVRKCRDDLRGFGTILKYYRVSCDRLASSSVQKVRLNSRAHGGQLNSLGREQPAITNPKNGKASDRYAVNIGGTVYHMKNMWYWDTYASSTYDVLKVTNEDGLTIYIMFDCGNIVTIGRYDPPKKPVPPPKPNDKCPNKPGLQTSLSQCDVCPNRSGTQLTLEQCDACPNIPGEQNTANCYPCPEAQDDDSATVCLKPEKTAANVTQGISNADGTMAKGGDVIAYTLTVRNSGRTVVKDFIFEEVMSDVLDYATITDLHGGNFDKDTATVSWPAQDILPGQTVKHLITAQIKNPIPSTPVGTSDPGSFDLMMTNTFYGDSVNIELPPNIIKRSEQVTRELPKTGPGTSLLVGFAVTTIVGYFFARSRLLATELAIVKDEYTSGGAS